MLADIGMPIKQLANVWMGDSGAGLFVLFVYNVLHVEAGYGKFDEQTGWKRHLDALEISYLLLLSVFADCSEMLSSTHQRCWQLNVDVYK